MLRRAIYSCYPKEPVFPKKTVYPTLNHSLQIMKKNKSSGATRATDSRKSRWFFLMNAVIALVVLSAVILLKDSASHYQPRSAFDTAYVEVTKNELDPGILQNGILYTEAARAHAYRSIIRQSNGTFIIGLLVSVAFIANSIFIYRLSASQNRPVGSTSPGT